MSLPQRPRHFSARPFLRTLLSPASMMVGRFRLKRTIASATTMLLALGVLTVGVAAPASAQTNAVSATVSCTTDYRWQIEWTVTNSESAKTESITYSSDSTLIPVGTSFAAGESKKFTEIVPTSTNKVLELHAFWSNEVSGTASGTVTKAQFTPACVAPAAESTGLYLYKKLDPTKDASWPNSGSQMKIITWAGWSYKEVYPSTLPSTVCGPGWGVQQDQINGPQSLFPGTIKYPDVGLFAAGVLHAARHSNLSSLATVPACAPIPHASVTTGACYANGEHSSADAHVVLSNTGNAPVTFTSSNGINLTLQGGESKEMEASPSWIAGGSFDITATGTGFARTFPITIPVNSACALQTGADPSAQTCVDDNLVNGQIHVLLNSRIVYRIDGAVVTGASTPVTPGMHSVTAELADPSGIYQLTGQSSWTFRSAAYNGLCELPAKALIVPEVTSLSISCYVAGSYILSGTEGVVWMVDGVEKPAGTYTVTTASTVHVVAKTVSSDYGFASDTKADWTLTFTKAEECPAPPTLALVTHPLVTPYVTHVNRTCAATGSYTLAAVEGIIYKVNGSVQPAGTYPVSTAKTVTVVASTVSSDFGFEQGVQTIWNLVFTAPGNCGELTTLAFTGFNGTLTGGLLLGLLFVMMGVGAITVSRVRKRT